MHLLAIGFQIKARLCQHTDNRRDGPHVGEIAGQTVHHAVQADADAPQFSVQSLPHRYTQRLIHAARYAPGHGGQDKYKQHNDRKKDFPLQIQPHPVSPC